LRWVVLKVILSRLINKAYESNEVVVAYVYGDFAVGKTSYALWVAYEVLGDWGEALDHLFFSPREAILKIKDAVERRERLKVIILDDAGTWLSKLSWWESYKVAFMEFFNLIRSVCSGVIFTTPTQELPKAIREKSFFRINVRSLTGETSKPFRDLIDRWKSIIDRIGLGSEFSVAVGYRLKVLPSCKELVEKRFYDVFPRHYPVFKEYEEKRMMAIAEYVCGVIEKIEKGDRKIRKMLREEERMKLYVYAEELLRSGKSRREVVCELMKRGIPQTTAYRWVNGILDSLRPKMK